MNIIGAALDELHRCFDILNAKYYEGKLPEPVISIQKSRPNNLGHFTLGKVWKNQNETENEESARYEININPVNMNRPAEEIIETLHHEMVHYVNRQNEIKDCNGQVHNKKFKTAAERVGLICEKSKQYGWGYTSLSESLKTFIVEEMKPDPKAFKYFRLGSVVPVKVKKPREKKSFKYICSGCDQTAKAGRDAKIKCGNCDELMETNDED